MFIGIDLSNLEVDAAEPYESLKNFSKSGRNKLILDAIDILDARDQTIFGISKHSMRDVTRSLLKDVVWLDRHHPPVAPGSRAACARRAAWRANFCIMTLRRAGASLLSGPMRKISAS